MRVGRYRDDERAHLPHDSGFNAPSPLPIAIVFELLSELEQKYSANHQQKECRH